MRPLICILITTCLFFGSKAASSAKMEAKRDCFGPATTLTMKVKVSSVGELFELKNPDTKLLGRIVDLDFEIDGRERSTRGRVIDATFAKQAASLDLLKADGSIEHLVLSSNQGREVKIFPDNFDWKISYGIPRDMEDLWGKRSNPHALVKIGSQYLWGKAEKIEIESGYSVLGITDAQGVQHLLDADYIQSVKVCATSGEERTKFLFEELKPSKPLKILDEKRTARRQLASELAEAKSVETNPRYYEALAEDLPSTKRLLMRWYEQDAEKLINTVSTEIGDKYLPLLADPGISNRLPQFIAFAKETLEKKKNLTPFQLREAFSKKLGTRRVYVAMYMTQKQLEYIKTNGLDAPGMRETAMAKETLFETLDPQTRYNVVGFGRSPREEIQRRVNGFRIGRSMNLSVSESKEVAAAAAQNINPDLPRGQDLYLMDLEVPELSLVKRDGIYIPYGVPKKQIRKISHVAPKA